jgi:hypothetical protein
MAYIGNNPEVNVFTAKVDKFSGTGACTQFTLSRTISDANAIIVVVNSVLQTPIASYNVSSGVVTFTEAPSLGTENVLVNYTSPITLTFNQVSSSQILANSVGTTQLAPNSVTTDKIAPGTIIATDIADDSVTNTKIANNAVTGEKISSPADIFDDAFLFGGM